MDEVRLPDRIRPSQRTEVSLAAVLRGSAAPYLSLLVVTVVAARFAQYLWPTQAVLKGQGAGIVVTFAGFVLALITWSLFRPESSWPNEFKVVVLAWGVLWGVSLGLSILHGDLFNVTAFLVPPILLMILMKKSSVTATFTAADVLAISLIVIAVSTQALDAAGIKLLANEGWNRWPLLAEIIGPIGRWQGPFGSVNYAGPAGTFLLVYGLLRPGWRRIVFVAAGAVIVFLSDSRSAMLACAVGIVSLIALAPRLGRHRNPTWLRIAAPVSLAAACAAYIAVIDPTFNLRTPVWEAFLDRWGSSPVVGVGGTGIQELIDVGNLPAWANHGHNLLIDPLGRYGLLGAVAVAGVVVAVAVVAVKAARRQFQAPLVLLCTFIAAGISDALVDWRYLGLFALPLMLAAMLGGAWLDQTALKTGERTSLEA